MYIHMYTIHTYVYNSYTSINTESTVENVCLRQVQTQSSQQRSQLFPKTKKITKTKMRTCAFGRTEVNPRSEKKNNLSMAPEPSLSYCSNACFFFKKTKRQWLHHCVSTLTHRHTHTDTQTHTDTHTAHTHTQTERERETNRVMPLGFRV
jgi:hypothetical protein